MPKKLCRSLIALLLAALPIAASEYHGVVTFSGVPVPGASVTAAQGDQKVTAVTDQQGAYSFPDLKDGTWAVDVEMPGFAPAHQDVTVAPGIAAAQWDLKLLPFSEIVKNAPTPPPAPPPAVVAQAPTKKGKQQAKTAPPASGFQRADVNASAAAPPAAASAAAEAIPSNATDSDAQRASDGLLINGSVNNGASSPFAQNSAFGNNRRGPGSLYHGGLGMIFDTSALDAKQFSLTGQDIAKPTLENLKGLFTLGGPLRIPRVLPNGPVFFVGYQWTHNLTAQTQQALVPTVDQRNGDAGNGVVIPQSLISPQARYLLNYFPLPNFAGGSAYNFETPLTNASNQDALQSQLSKNLGQRTQLYGSFNFQRIATSTPSIFGFLDTGKTFGLNAAVNWQRRIGTRFFAHAQFQYSYQSVRATPYFANRENVSGEAGIMGNEQSPADWGPPTLIFSSGINSLTDAINSFNRNQTGAWKLDGTWIHGRHNIQFGGDFRRQEFNYLGQTNPRGTFTFTGADTGSAFGDFLTGVPDTSQLAFGNADKYFRENVWDGFLNDDWRVGPSLTLDVGGRWEYGSPISELYGRLVNLSIAPGFSAATPVVGNGLMQPDRHGIEPRIGLAWRPFPASSTVVRAGYGVYYNTSVYQSIAIQMAQQAPLSRSVNVQNSAADPLTLANGFNLSPTITPDTFGVNPNFQVGYTQNWQASIQRDLPGSMVATVTYLGIKGTRGMQEFLPNTYPMGAVNPCPTCPTGFTYLTSNGDSTRESGSLQLRRRLHNGFTATLQYTYSKSIDDSALGGRGTATYVIAQNWLDLSAERGLSTFDQRHLLNLQMQYSTGEGLGGGTLLSGWRGALFKEWTFLTNITVGTGLPLTPIDLAAVPGTGNTGSIRPNYLGGSNLNAADFSAPLPGQWGDAGRDSITGPYQFTLNASLARTFRVNSRLNLDLRFDSTNTLNHVTWTAWNTVINSPSQFGLPQGANQMRAIQTTLRLRF